MPRSDTVPNKSYSYARVTLSYIISEASQVQFSIMFKL